MKRKINRNIALCGLLSALYVVLSLTLKIPFGIGNIALDMGYLALTVGCYALGPYACIVGAIGAAANSLLTSAYGLSVGWVAMNFIIGLIAGIICKKAKKTWIVIVTVIGAVFLGVIAKTMIECALYAIPIIVKLPKSLVAFVVDSIVMIAGIPLAGKLNRVL